MNTIQKIGFTAIGLLSTTASTFAAISWGSDKVSSSLKWSEATADSAVQTLIGNFMMFLALIGVCYGLWGGFQIVTAGGEEEKVKKGRTILIQVLIGLVVIFLANSIVQWALQKILV